MWSKIKLSSFLGFCICLAAGCAKSVVNDTILPPTQLNAASSSIRVYNLFGFGLDVTVNNVPLTSYSATNSNGTAQGLALFPTGIWTDGTSFTIPYTLLDKNGQAHISIAPRNVFNGSTPITIPADTLLTDNPLNPVDYYILADGHYHALPRSAAAPSQPTAFKIRVVNMTSPTDINGIAGSVSLTYADGSYVDPKLMNIPAGGVSDYIELPYAAIEFKLFANNNFQQQLTELPILPNFIGEGLQAVPKQEARFSPTRTYKPGGIYTVFASNNILVYTTSSGENEYIPANAYRVLSENSPAVNYIYARIMAFNAYPQDGQYTVDIDGQQIGTPVSYTGHSDYSIQVQGKHTLTAYNQQGTLLAQKDITLYPYDNITAWLYQKDTGGADFCFSPMDMSLVQTDLLFDVMDLCVGVPYLTLTNSSTLFYTQTINDFIDDTATTNVPYAQDVEASRYHWDDLTPTTIQGDGSAIVSPGLSFYDIRAWSSNTGPPMEVPGVYMANVTPLEPYASFIANPAMYSVVPQGEPGAYTVMLVGKTGATGIYAPRLLTLKHSK